MRAARRPRIALWLLALLTGVGPIAPVHAVLHHGHAAHDSDSIACDHEHGSDGPALCSIVPEPLHADCATCQSSTRTLLSAAGEVRSAAVVPRVGPAPRAPDSLVRRVDRTTAAARAPPLPR